MAWRSQANRSLTDRLEAMESRIRVDFVERIAELRGAMEMRFTSLSGDVREIKGLMRGALVVAGVLVPVATALAVLAVQLGARHLGLG